MLNTLFIFSCGVIGLILLRKANLCLTLIPRQNGSRRSDAPVEFPLTDSHDLFVFKDRRQLSDRRKAKLGLDDLKAMPPKMGSHTNRRS